MNFFSRLRRAFAGPPPTPVAHPQPAPVTEFDRRTDAAIARLRQWPAGSATGPEIAVLITPWVETAVPFWSLETACALEAAGCRIVLVWDDCDLAGGAVSNMERAAITRLVSAAAERFEVARFDSTSGPSPDGEDLRNAESLARENAVWQTRGETGAADYVGARPSFVPAISRHLAAARTWLVGRRPSFILLPGGIYGVSGSWLAGTRRAAVPFTTYDSGDGILLLAHSGLASQQADAPAAVERIKAVGPAAALDRCATEAGAELSRRTAGRDQFSYQAGAATGEAIGDANVLVALNVRWDAAALGRQRLFASVADWLDAVLDWTAAEPSARVCIRQHPIERHQHLRGSDDIAGLLAKHAGLGPRLRFVAAADPVSTYDLLRSARVVLPFTSSIGLEAAMLAKTVVLGTDCYYAAMPFVIAPATRGEYFARIAEALAGSHVPDDAARREAALAYHVTQNCSFTRTVFTPQPADFDRWSATPPAALWAQPELADLREALLTRVPLPYLRHRRLFHAS